MGLDLKRQKKLISLGLALGLTVTSVPLWRMPVTVQAADEIVVFDAAARGETAAVTLDTVREEARALYQSSKKAFDIDLSGQTFSGTGLDYSTDADGRSYMQVFENLKTGTEDQTVIFRFKSNNANGLLFGAGTNDAGNGKNMIFALKNNQLRVLLRNVGSNGSADTGLKGGFGSNLADGEWHTVAISFMPSKGMAADNIRIVIDGGSEAYKGTGWGATRKTGFNQNTDNYTKFEIGGGAYANADVCSSAAFHGEIDFITVINKAYSVEELQRFGTRDKNFANIHAGMFAAGTCNTWLFTGGTEAVASFKVNGTTRNWVGMVEDKTRDGGSFVERGRFMFNTAKRGADIAQILEEYDTRIAPFGTDAVAVMVGKADYSKGTDGVEAFKASLRMLVERIKNDNKYPLLITPYPSKNAEDNTNIASYKEAIQQVAGTGVKVVDLSTIAASYVKDDGTLTPAGHQAVANTIKRALNLGSVETNYAMGGLADGVYTVAKKAEDGTEAQVKEVTAGTGSIKVSVDAASISGNTAQLTYVLTDTEGQKISGSAEEGQTEFTVEGLKQGETYTLDVYDASRGNVKESYQPVTVTVTEGAKGISREYEDGNVSANEKIRSLLTSKEPATYLFMGDSITHGVVTSGYDNVPQMFAKYLDEIGRTEDIVLNTGVSNATIATTLNQIEPRLTRYQPDVVMIMLGTNDVSNGGQNTVTNGNATPSGITVEQFKERYKELVQKIYDNNHNTSIVLRVPCEMLVDGPHAGYEPKFDAIYNVADEMRQAHDDLNITVVNHRKGWLDYKDNVRGDNIARGTTYGWLVDNVHPNGRGNIAMFQQIIKELGLYVPTSEMANYQYALNEWTGTSPITAQVIQKATRARFDMSVLSRYTNGLKNVTLTLTADGVSISKTVKYSADGTITLDGLDAEKTYTPAVTGKDSRDSKEISFNTTLTKATEEIATESEKQVLKDSLQEASELEASAYPEEAYQAYKDAIKKIEDELLQESMTVEEVEYALEQVRIARENLVKAAETDRKAAKAGLEDALSKTEATYKAGKSNWTDATWAAYEAAYQNAKKADDSTDAATLKELLAKLTDARKKLTEKKPETPGEKDPGQQGNPEPSNPNQPVVKGQVIANGNYRYKVTSAEKLTAEVSGLVKDTAKITIYDSVNLGGKQYKITSVAASAFKNNKKVTSVTIKKNLETIGNNAFAGCTKLKKVTCNSTKLKQIGKKAFFNCKSLKTITLKKTKVLKKVGANAFKGINKKAVIKVSAAKAKAYKKLLAKKGQSKTVKIK